jgi:hypothetical protein
MAPAFPQEPAARVAWTRQPVMLAAGAVILVISGVIMGVNASCLWGELSLEKEPRSLASENGLYVTYDPALTLTARRVGPISPCAKHSSAKHMRGVRISSVQIHGPIATQSYVGDPL